MVRTAVALLTALLLAACNEPPTEPAGPGLPAALEVVSGGGQETVTGARFSDPVVVRLLDAERRPIPDRTLSATPHEGGGWVVEERVATDAEGLARFDWYAGVHAGEPQRLGVALGAHAAEVEGTVRAPTPGTSYFGHRVRRGARPSAPGLLPGALRHRAGRHMRSRGHERRPRHARDRPSSAARTALVPVPP